MINGIVRDLGVWISNLVGVSTSIGEMIGIGVIVAAWILLMVGLVTLMWKYRRALLRGRELNISPIVRPRIPGIDIVTALRLPIPKVSFQLSSWRGLGIGLVAVAIGFAAAFTLVIKQTDNTPHWPKPGAVYALGSPMGTSGVPLEPDLETPSEPSQTLKINLADGIRIEHLKFDGMDLGKPALDVCFQITRNTGNTTGFLFVDDFIISGSTSAPTVDIANTHAYEAHFGGAVDGHTMEATMSNAVTSVVVESMRDVASYTGSGTVDRVIINLLGSATVRSLTVHDTSCSVGSWDLDYIKASKLQFNSTTSWGAGTGVNAASFVVNSTTLYNTMVDTMVDKPVSVR